MTIKQSLKELKKARSHKSGKVRELSPAEIKQKEQSIRTAPAKIKTPPPRTVGDVVVGHRFVKLDGQIGTVEFNNGMRVKTTLGDLALGCEILEALPPKAEARGEKEKSMSKGTTEAVKAMRVEAYGVKGMNSNPWRKTFKSAEALTKWAEKNDAEIQGTRNEEAGKPTVEAKKEKETTVKTSAKKKAVKKASPKTGQRAAAKKPSGKPQIFGHSVSSVLFWMGKEGFNREQVEAALATLKVKSNPNTIAERIGAGKSGKRGEAPKLTADQAKVLKDAAKSA